MAKKVNWPSKEELKKILPKLESSEGSLHLSEEATPVEKFRYQLCQKLLAYKIENNLKQRELAGKLGIDESIVSKIFHHRIEGISTDRLLEYVQSIFPDTKLLVS